MPSFSVLREGRRFYFSPLSSSPVSPGPAIFEDENEGENEDDSLPRWSLNRNLFREYFAKPN